MAKVRVLVVDDSGFFRRRIRELLTADTEIEVVGEAGDGREAVRQAVALKPDVITMDIEMPVLDGISAVREIMRRQPTPVLMFSSLTVEGARATLDALDAGAVDFLPKRFSDLASDSNTAQLRLQQRVKAVVRPNVGSNAVGKVENPGVNARRPAVAREPAGFRPRAVIMGASTGGPVALQKVLTGLPAGFPLPILLVQHMPQNFTNAFAQRLDGLCALNVREAADGDALQAGRALLAPGGQHIGLVARGDRLCVKLLPSRPGQFYKPSVDIALASAADACGGQALGIVLTGMGSDGAEGARRLNQCGGMVWAQDEASCVIYGMPRAVAQAGVADRVMSLSDFGSALQRLVA